MCSYLTLFAMACLTLSSFTTSFLTKNSPLSFLEVSEDGFLSTDQFLEKFNYHHEKHIVKTPDGYFIEIHRVRGRKGKPKVPSTAPTILMMPGLCVPDGLFVMHGPGKSNGLCLSDEGFDVWMGNNRGGRYGTRHTNLTVNDREFWNFELFELTVTDTAAIIDYVLSHVGKPKLHYAGYSLGGMGIHYLLSLRPEYNDKIKSLYLITTALSIKNTKSNVLRLIARLRRTENKEFLYKWNPTMVFSKKAVEETFALRYDPVRLAFNYAYYDTIFGPYGPNYNLTRHLTYISQSLSGCSESAMLEVGELILLEDFKMLDLGEELNLKKYGTKHPHVVNTLRIEPPKVYFYGENDYLMSTKDVLWTANAMKNVLEIIPLKDHNHGTTVTNADIKEKITDHIARYVRMLD